MFTILVVCAALIAALYYFSSFRIWALRQIGFSDPELEVLRIKAFAEDIKRQAAQHAADAKADAAEEERADAAALAKAEAEAAAAAKLAEANRAKVIAESARTQSPAPLDRLEM